MKKIILILTLALACFASAHPIKCEPYSRDDGIISFVCLTTIASGDTIDATYRFLQKDIDKACSRITRFPYPDGRGHLSAITKLYEGKYYTIYQWRDPYETILDDDFPIDSTNVMACRDLYNGIVAMIEGDNTNATFFFSASAKRKQE